MDCGEIGNGKSESVRRELSTIGHIFKIALERWGIYKKPNGRHTITRKGKPRTQRVTEEDINTIVAISGYVDTLKTAKARTVAAMLFAVETAMRAGEICSLSWDNVNFEKRTAFLPMTKTVHQEPCH